MRLENWEEEAWRPIVGYEGMYEVSDLGRVRSVPRFDSRGNRRKGKLRKQDIKEGYAYVSLCRNGKNRKQLVSRIVLEAFVGPAEGREACHYPSPDPSNNRLDNLLWGTRADNMSHMLKDGTHPSMVRGGNARLDEGGVLEARRLHSAGVRNAEIAKHLGVNHSTVWRAVSGESWKWLS